MSHIFGPSRKPFTWPRRIALALVVALQGAIAVSPLFEPTEKGRLGAHAEEKGAQHRYQHDESTCAVCAVRSLHSSPARGCPPIVSERQQAVATLDAPVAPQRQADPTTLPRAPPRLS
jgi:hypothetical protein